MENGTVCIERIGNTIQQLKQRMKNEESSGVEILDKILHDNNFQSLLQIYEAFQLKNEARHSFSICDKASELVKEVQLLQMQHQTNTMLTALTELLNSSPHLEALLSCHDKIANKDFDVPQLSDISFDPHLFDNESTEHSIKVVRLVKSDEPLGATIATDEATGNIIIARIIKGGAADRSGLIHANDVLVEINGTEAKGKCPSEIIKLLAGFRGPLVFKLIPGESPKDGTGEKMYVRSRFTYLPQADNLIPCVEAGLTFYPGDVLCVVSKDDNSWWQAMKIESFDKPKQSMNKVGLIPSMKLQTRREKLKRLAAVKPSTTGSIKGSKLSLLSNGRRNAWNMIRASFRRKRHDSSLSHTFDSVQQMPYFLPYEVVTKYTFCEDRSSSKRPKLYRPIVLVGPQGVGRNELKDRLIDSNPSHYGVPVPHTSRAKQTEEEDGKDYHFVTREYMENGIRENLFLEYGEYKGNLYGTSLEAVHSVIEAGLVCVLTPYPQALTMLRTKEFKSYVIFIKPPSVLEMGQLDGMEDFADVDGKLTIERPGKASFTDEEIKNLVTRSEKLESMYGRLFDTIITNDNSDRALNQLKALFLSLENESQWVPVDWVS